jgi:hypothetical protein
VIAVVLFSLSSMFSVFVSFVAIIFSVQIMGSGIVLGISVIVLACMVNCMLSGFWAVIAISGRLYTSFFERAVWVMLKVLFPIFPSIKDRSFFPYSNSWNFLKSHFSNILIAFSRYVLALSLSIIVYLESVSFFFAVSKEIMVSSSLLFEDALKRYVSFFP